MTTFVPVSGKEFPVPLVVVNYQKNEIDPVIVRNVANGLPKIVARALDVVGNEQARLSAGD
ncbi:MAG: hypothetical protein AAB799_02500, partial [Patescibacteria group bacterium]